MLHTKNQGSMPYVLRQKIFFQCIPYKSLSKQEGQEALNRSPEFLKLTYRYLLKAGHVPGDTWGGTDFGIKGIIWANLVEVN